MIWSLQANEAARFQSRAHIQEFLRPATSFPLLDTVCVQLPQDTDANRGKYQVHRDKPSRMSPGGPAVRLTLHCESVPSSSVSVIDTWTHSPPPSHT